MIIGYEMLRNLSQGARCRNKKQKAPVRVNSVLKAGDSVMVIAGGHKQKRPNKGKVAKILRFAGKKKDRVVLEGVNIVTKHQRATQPGQQGGRIQKEAPIHVSNVMYYVEELKRPVRLKHSTLEDGTKVRGYMHPEKNEFVQLAS